MYMSYLHVGFLCFHSSSMHIDRLFLPDARNRGEALGFSGGTRRLPPLVARFSPKVMKFIAKTPQKGAETPVLLATAGLDKVGSGGYWADSKQQETREVTTGTRGSLEIQ